MNSEMYELIYQLRNQDKNLAARLQMLHYVLCTCAVLNVASLLVTIFIVFGGVR